MDVRLHPLFQDWLEDLADPSGPDELFDVYIEVMALISALEEFGRDLGDPECHPVVTASYDLHALRRSPPTSTTPYAQGPPVLRILFGYVRSEDRQEVAVVALGGDKIWLGNAWYPANVTQAQDRIDQWCQIHPGFKPLMRRGGLR
ncbi:MAG: hypothetical protein F4Y27_09340 [Acidimicrobiaceae bacterium]|nr:hypothetical protein [Acidimicrobiaceae bacterium]MXW62076.1 hypothetical protein [Acidimicrobiaceae bacterium]MYA74868.1 hypothetical protein [Acidimicrobiaceae bacterium]MYC43665.1 hypothetical protein [Acidimicrobiaceae bacterium]MYG56030.1 hypothetical protein [Acidimicrobiaceae bacterium]